MSTIRDRTHEIGQHVRSLRRARGLTQQDLAGRAGVAVDTIRRIEQGRASPTIGMLCKVSSGLDLDVCTLFESLRLEGRSAVSEIADVVELLDHAQRDALFAFLRSLVGGEG
jgi:transcriptional regulator with XRE-family HTH domain